MDLFLADPHLSHKNIIEFERTQFKTIEAHDDFIKNLITSSVKPHDTLYVLGDVGDLTADNIQFWQELPCKTILIRGNHDTQKSKLTQAFDVVSDVPIFYKKRVLLSHEPLPVTNETINIHGHLHGARLNKSNYINLSIHVNKYKLLTEKDIERLVAVRPKIAQNFMYEWYAKDYIFETEKSEIAYTIFGNIDLEKTRLHLFNKNPMKRKLESTVDAFLEKYPSYKHANIEDEIKDFLIKNYQNNANFTIEDVHRFINNPFK